MSNGLILGAELHVRAFCYVIDEKSEIFARVIMIGLTAGTQKFRNTQLQSIDRVKLLFKYYEMEMYTLRFWYCSDLFLCKINVA